MSINISPYYFSRQKRFFDLCLALWLLIILSPIFAIIMLLLAIINGRPIFFLQKRMGQGERPFTIFKFRTMHLGAEKEKQKFQNLNEAPFPSFKIMDDPRFIRLGKFLSRTGLDELPQLFNILKGEMSFIGPRPLPVEEALSTPQSWKYRYQVKPGILSLWALSDKRFESLHMWQKLEESTLKNGSLLFDFHILLNSFLIPMRYLIKIFH